MSSISARQQVAQNLSDLCVCGGLNEVYGVSCEKATADNGKSYWAVTFCKAKVLDGVIRIYSPNFILVSWQTAYGDMPHTGKEVFRSELAAKEFIQRSFIRV